MHTNAIQSSSNNLDKTVVLCMSSPLSLSKSNPLNATPVGNRRARDLPVLLRHLFSLPYVKTRQATHEWKSSILSLWGSLM